MAGQLSSEIEQEIAVNRLETLWATYNLKIDERGFASFLGEELARECRNTPHASS